MSYFLIITASIIQRAAVGPAVYVVNAGDLTSVTSGNQLFNKYADDTYFVVPAANICSRETELEHIEKWASSNNLTINRKKSPEIVFTESRRRRTVCLPHPLTDIERVTSMKILGITVTYHLSVREHVQDVTSSFVQSVHALKILRCHGMRTESLQMIFKAVVVAKLTYVPHLLGAWGFTTADDRNRVDGLLRRGERVGLHDGPTVAQISEEADDRLFNSIIYLSLIHI